MTLIEALKQKLPLLVLAEREVDWRAKFLLVELFGEDRLPCCEMKLSTKLLGACYGFGEIQI